MDKYLSLSTSLNDSKPKPAKQKKYDNNYFDFSFIENSDGKQKSVLQVLANEGKVPPDYEVSRVERQNKKLFLAIEQGIHLPEKTDDLISKTFKILVEKYKCSLESN